LVVGSAGNASAEQQQSEYERFHGSLTDDA
jgi:hypothetical protein